MRKLFESSVMKVRKTQDVENPTVYVQCYEHADHWMGRTMKEMAYLGMSSSAITLDPYEEAPRCHDLREKADVLVFVLTIQKDVVRFMEFVSHAQPRQPIVVFSPNVDVANQMLPAFRNRFKDYFAETCIEAAAHAHSLLRYVSS